CGRATTTRTSRSSARASSTCASRRPTARWPGRARSSSTPRRARWRASSASSLPADVVPRERRGVVVALLDVADDELLDEAADAEDLHVDLALADARHALARGQEGQR